MTENPGNPGNWPRVMSGMMQIKILNWLPINRGDEDIDILMRI